jgi:peroxiredoxin
LKLRFGYSIYSEAYFSFSLFKIIVMKIKIQFIAFLVTLAFVILSCKSSKEPENRGFIINIGDDCPDFEMVLANDSLVKMSDLRGKIVMLQFTASWCGVCREEMPHIENEIWQPLKSKDLVVIGIDRDEPVETVRKFASEIKITYPLALDPGAQIFSRFALKESGVTRNVIVDKNGKIAYLTRLFNMEEFGLMKTKIEELLQQ